jgi:NADH-quinone oxidoreductase subunit L
MVGIHAFSHYLEPVFPKHEAHHLDAGIFGMLLTAALAAAGLGMFVALRTRFEITGPLHKVLSNKWYVDEVYNYLFVDGLAKRGGSALAAFDRNVVDGAVNGAAWLTVLNSRITIFWDTWVVDGLVRLTGFAFRLASYPSRLLQTGHVQTYAMYLVLGLLAMFGVYVTRS